MRRREERREGRSGKKTRGERGEDTGGKVKRLKLTGTKVVDFKSKYSKSFAI